MVALAHQVSIALRRYRRLEAVVIVLGYIAVTAFGLSLGITPPPPVTATFGPVNPARWAVAIPFIAAGFWGVGVRATGQHDYEQAALGALAFAYVAYVVNAAIALALHEYPGAAAISQGIAVLTFITLRLIRIKVDALLEGERPTRRPRPRRALHRVGT